MMYSIYRIENDKEIFIDWCAQWDGAMLMVEKLQAENPDAEYDVIEESR